MLFPGQNAATPLPSDALARPKRTRRVLVGSYSVYGDITVALRIQLCGGWT